MPRPSLEKSQVKLKKTTKSRHDQSPGERFYSIEPSPIGPLTVVTDQSHLLAISFGRATKAELAGMSHQELPAIHCQTRQQLKEYFAGKRRQFQLAVASAGTAFQQQVWQALTDIPFGETASYLAIATAIGNPKACRAVGAANGKNPIPIVIPCHRVIGADGSLTGFAGGLGTKVQLLSHEGWRSPAAKQDQRAKITAKTSTTYKIARLFASYR